MATAPLKPNPVTISNLASTSFTATVPPPGNGGSAIDGYAIWIGTVNDYNQAQQYIMTNPVTNVRTFTGLVSGRTYYVWGQARNQVGPFWGPLSNVTVVTTQSVPAPPGTPIPYNVTNVSVHVECTSSTNGGGMAVLEQQVAYGTSPTIPQLFSDITLRVGTVYQTDLTGLAPATTYYMWTRARNALGWSAYSARAQFTTLNVPPAPDPVTFSLVTQSSLTAAFTGPSSNGGSTIVEYQMAYGTDPNTGMFFITPARSTPIANLDPGLTYYFWVRARNGFGWGPWSQVRSVTLVAGAMVKVDTAWKRAVPYVNVGGVWKMATPYVKTAGVWKETQ